MKHLNKNILYVALGLIILLAIATKGFSNLDSFVSMGKNPSNIALEYIKEQVLKQNPAADIKLISSKKEYGVTKVMFSIEGQEMEAYISNDGKVLFPEAIVIDKSELLKDIPKTNKPDVKLFTMTFCPYGSMAEELMIPLAELFKDKADIKLNYVIYENYPSAAEFANYCLDNTGQYCAMHGVPELKQNVREACIFKYNKDVFWNYVAYTNDKCTLENIEQCWKESAAELGIDIAKIETCFKNEAKTILEEQVTLGEKHKVNGSPVLVINGVEYKGDRSEEGYKKAICAAFKVQPKECK